MGLEERLSTSDEEQEEEEDGDWEDWNEAGSINSRAVEVGTDNDDDSEAKCLLCSTRRPSAEHAFEHCSQEHGLDFAALRRQSQIGFYDSLRLINYIRSQVAVKTCWNCGAQYDSEQSLLEHLNAARHSTLPHSSNGQDTSAPWKSDSYLVPSLENDALLYSLDESNDEDPEEFDMIDKNAIFSELAGLDSEALAAGQSIDGPLMELMDGLDNLTFSDGVSATPSNASAQVSSEQSNGTPAAEKIDGLLEKRNPLRKNLKVTFGSVAQKEISNVNSKYFSSYGEYGIHREMLGDKERTGAYHKAILNNPTLFKDASVLDIGCGTGILSLFAAKAGSSKVIAVDGSEKMVSVAHQVARDNGYICDGADSAITVVGGMIEDLDGKLPLDDHSVDIIVSEWMGYCLLYESMLGSVLHARDRWLKPGGAMLPDVAEIHMAGFGKGGTSLPFWEDVYGFNLKHIGEEVVRHAAEFPIIDVIDKKDVITESCLIKKFDLVTMRHEDVDFTALFELKPKFRDTTKTVTWCYGVVLWFDTGFTERFCKEDPVVLTTSPSAPSTHWSQTLLTFNEPIALSQAAEIAVSGELGTEAVPAIALRGRISIARSFKHRSIDISLETTAVGTNGATRMLPVQIFEI